MGWQDLRIPAAEAIGAVDLATLEEAAPAFDEVATVLGTAAAELEAADTGRLLGPVAAGYEDALETLERRAKIALDTRDLVEMLPRFLGRRREAPVPARDPDPRPAPGHGRRGDARRASCGAKDGVHEAQHPLAPAGDAFAEATATTDARAAGENLLAAASEAGLGNLDGVLLADSLWLADALWTTGSAEVSDRVLPVNSDEAARVLEREVFEGRNAAAASTRHAEVANAIVESYLSRRPATEAFAIALARDVADRHLVVVASRPKERRVLERLGAGGAPARTGRPAGLGDLGHGRREPRRGLHAARRLPPGHARARRVGQGPNDREPRERGAHRAAVGPARVPAARRPRPIPPAWTRSAAGPPTCAWRCPRRSIASPPRPASPARPRR